MKRVIGATALSVLLLSVGGMARAAEPIVLADAELDAISAGALSAGASGSAYALFGIAVSSSAAGSITSGPVRIVSASGGGAAIGIGTGAGATAFIHWH